MNSVDPAAGHLAVLFLTPEGAALLAAPGTVTTVVVLHTDPGDLVVEANPGTPVRLPRAHVLRAFDLGRVLVDNDAPEPATTTTVQIQGDFL